MSESLHNKDNKRAVTMTDVARAAQVSPATVSVVLNGRGEGHRISAETIGRVQRVAGELGYAPNGVARSLRRRKTEDVGVLLPHLRNDWAHHVMEGIERVLDREGLVPLIVNHREDSARSARGLDALVERRVRGLICNPMQEETAHYQRVIDKGVPTVFLGDVPDGMPGASYAAWDPEEVRTPVRHLIEIGRSRIAFLGYEDRRELTLARYKAVRAVVVDSGLSWTDDHFALRPRAVGFDEALRMMFSAPVSERPDAVFALYDDVAMQAIDTLRGMGVAVPDDVVVAATGTGLDAGFRAYGLTVMQAPVVEEGAAAARLLVEKLRDPTSDRTEIVRGGRLLIGRTTVEGAPVVPAALTRKVQDRSESVKDGNPAVTVRANEGTQTNHHREIESRKGES